MSKFPVYNICNLNGDKARGNDDILIEDFHKYLSKHYPTLHFPHRHSFYHLVLFKSGLGSHTIDFKNFELHAGQVYFMIPGQVHSWQFEGAVDGYIINFSENFFRSYLLNPSYLDKFSFFSGNADDCVVQLKDPFLSTVIQLMDELLERSKTTVSGQSDILKVLIIRLLLLIEEAAGTKPTKVVSQQKATILKSFRALIEKNYKDLKLPNEYASLLYITPHHLNALSQELAGKSAGELIRDRILLEAKRLLVNRELTAAEIALELNFKDASYFNRFFKKATGVTPFEFRKQINNK